MLSSMSWGRHGYFLDWVPLERPYLQIIKVISLLSFSVSSFQTSFLSFGWDYKPISHACLSLVRSCQNFSNPECFYLLVWVKVSLTKEENEWKSGIVWYFLKLISNGSIHKEKLYLSVSRLLLHTHTCPYTSCSLNKLRTSQKMYSILMLYFRNVYF